MLTDYFRYRRNRLIEKFFKKLRECLLGHQILVKDESGTEELNKPKFLEAGINKSQASKENMLQFFAFMVGDSRNLKVYLDSLPMRERNMYSELLDSGYVDLTKAEALLGRSLLEEAKEVTFWGSYDKMEEMVFATYESFSTRSSWHTDFYMFLATPFHKFIFLALHPEWSLEVQSQASFPKDITIHSLEPSTLKILPIADAVLSQAALIGKTQKISATALKKAILQLGTEEFFTDESLPKDMLTLRRSMILQLAALFRHHFSNYARKNKSLPIEQRLRTMFDRLLKYPDIFIPVIFYYMTGLRENIISESYSKDIVVSLVSELKSLKNGEWYDVKDILNDCFMKDVYAFHLEFFQIYQLSRATIRNKFTGNEEPITPDRLKEELGLPLVKGLLMCLAAFGILDIAVSEFYEDDCSPYDGVEYIRITNLGAYVLMKTEEYTPPKIEDHEVYFDLDPNRLILRSIVKDNPYEGLLTDTCVPIGNSRYKMSAETFLAHCQNRNDVEDKIKFFKRYISGDLSEIWTHFFDSLLQRCNPLTSVNSMEYRIFQIGPTNKSLMRLLTSDPKLSQMTIRAENYTILVKTSDLQKFINRLKSLGYLM